PRKEHPHMVKRKSRKFSIIGALVFLLPILLIGQAPTSASIPAQLAPGGVKTDVTYCTPNGVPLRMDIYFPMTTVSGPSPVAMYVHGGGWTSGDKSWVDTVLKPSELTR